MDSFFFFIAPSDKMERRLEPFSPKLLAVSPFTGDAIAPVEDFECLGFKERSAQGNFLRAASSNTVVVLVHEVHTSPQRMDDVEVVASAFGSTNHQGDAVIWYVGVNKRHTFNDSKQGTRWGHYGLTKDTSGAKTRWKSGNSKLTMRNHGRLVKGSANPYAVLALWSFLKYTKAQNASQHPELPCAQLFHPKYDHTTHPATQLIYNSLGFIKSPMGNYVRYNSTSSPLNDWMREYLERLQLGLDASNESRARDNL